MIFQAIGLKKGPLYLGLGALVATGAAACSDAPEPDWDAPSSDAVETVVPKGVTTIIREVADGSYQIEDEQITDGPSRLVIVHDDGRVENIVDPDSFAQKLPATPPPPQEVENRYHRGGFGLMDVLLMSAIMNAWRPMGYMGYHYTPPPQAYRNPQRYQGAAALRSQYRAYQQRGLAPGNAVEAKQMRTTAPRTRATAPSRPRSGFGGGTGRSFGG